ncbi:MAG: helix-turn-helix transcriptional regulator [Anaeroplasmataceae bacterium]|nr:helix-turn-helix transcriptional regulator [Anaeroplasmataceae bacterium]
MSNTLKTAVLLRQLRKVSNMTIQDVAQAMGVSKAAISKWETGDGIKTEYLFDLSKFFGIKFSELLNGKLDNESNSDYWRRNYDLSNYDFDES